MGLRDKLKKKSEKAEKPEEIGGLNLSDMSLSERMGHSETEGIDTQDTEDANAPFAQGFPEFTPQPETEPAAAKKDDVLSSLDIFGDEVAEEDEGLNLAKQLPEVDIQDLLRECQDIAAQFKEKTG